MKIDQLLNRMPLTFGILLLVDSLHFVFARALKPYLPGGTGAFFVLGVATIEMTLFLGVRRSIKLTVFRQHAPFFLTIGFMVAAATALNYTAVSFVDAGTAAMLAQTSTLFALILGVVWLRDTLNIRQIMGAALTILGVFIIYFQPGDFLRLGSLLVLASAFMYALHAAVVKRYGESLDFANFFLFRVASTTFFLFCYVLLQQQLVLPTANIAWLYLLAAGTIDVVISRVLYYLVLRRMTVSIHALLLTLSPVITIGWSLVLFAEWPTWMALGGGLSVVAGVLLVTIRPQRKRGTS